MGSPLFKVQKEITMREIDIVKLRGIQLDILDSVDTFCKENGIKYWLDKGTLLGAVRHKGYIPWDDDIDIGMLREDYETFRKSYKSDRFKLINIDNEPELFCPFGKVVDRGTLLIEDNRYLLSVNIDVDIYDNAPENDKTVQKMFDKRDRLRRLSSLQKQPVKNIEGGLTGALKRARRSALKLLSRDYFMKQMVKNAKSFSGCDTRFVANFLEYGRCVVDRDIFSSTVSCTFEGREYPAPKDYDRLLKAYYGDYMTPPPEEKQITHHNVRAYPATEKDSIKLDDLTVMNYISKI